MAKTNGPCANSFLYENIRTVDDIPYSIPHNLTNEQLVEFYMISIKILEEAGENERAKICREKLNALDDHQNFIPELVEKFEAVRISKLQKSIKEHKRQLCSQENNTMRMMVYKY